MPMRCEAECRAQALATVLAFGRSAASWGSDQLDFVHEEATKS